MNTDPDGYDAALERRFDWAMAEVVRGEQAPDVVASVLARRAKQPVGAAKLLPHRSRPSLLSAALALLGLGVVTWLLLAQRVPEVDETQGQNITIVSSIDAIDLLPETAKAVELRGLADAAVDKLVQRCPGLRLVSVRNSRRLTSAVGHVLRTQLSELREVRLSGCPQVNDVTVAELIALLSLRRVVLDGTSVSEHSFPLLQSAHQLRYIDLGEAPWLTLTMAERLMQSGKHVVASQGGNAGYARALASLTDRYAYRLDQPYYRVVGKLEEIEALPDSVVFVELRKLGDEATKLLAKRPNLRGIAYIRDDRDDFTIESMRLLATMTSLEELQLGNVMKWDGSGLELLANLGKLRLLRMSSVPVDDDGLAALPKMLALRDLELVGVRTFGDRGLASLAQCRELTRLDLSGCDQLTDQQLCTVGQLTRLRDLNLSHTRVGEDTVTALLPLTQLERLTLDKCNFSDAAARSLGGMQKLATLKLSNNSKLSSAGLLELPVSLRELHLSQCTGFDKSACAILRDRFPQLAMLNAGAAEWIDDEGLAAILENQAMHHLMINGCTKMTLASYKTLRAARNLHRLSAIFSSCLDDDLQKQLATERPDMKIDRRAW